jgi:hypothetical protein
MQTYFPSLFEASHPFLRLTVTSLVIDILVTRKPFRATEFKDLCYGGQYNNVIICIQLSATMSWDKCRATAGMKGLSEADIIVDDISMLIYK